MTKYELLGTVLTEFRELEKAADALSRQVLKLATIGKSKSKNRSEKAQLELSRVLAKWERIASRLEGLCGIALASLSPEELRSAVGGFAAERAKNLVDLVETLRAFSAHFQLDDPFQSVAEQPRAYENLQRVIAVAFPEDLETFASLFKTIGFPLSGFEKPRSPTTQRQARFDSLDIVHLVTVPVSAQIQVGSEKNKVRILHLSDLHRTEDEKVTNAEVYNDLEKALRAYAKSIDLVLVTGDVVQSPSTTEYQEAENFLKKVASQFLPVGKEKDRLVVIPGNHDVDWSRQKEMLFQAVKGKLPVDGKQYHGVFNFSGGYAIPNATTFALRFERYNEFFTRFFGTSRPNVANDYCAVESFPELSIAVVSLNTAVGMHHLSQEVDVDRERLSHGLAALSKIPDSTLKIAIGHHGPVRDKNQHDVLPAFVIDRLAQNCTLYLHGHVHESIIWREPTGMTTSGFHSVGVGSLVAGPGQRPESPRQFHLLEFDLTSRTGTVFIWKKDKRDSPWEPDPNRGGSQGRKIVV